MSISKAPVAPSGQTCEKQRNTDSFFYRHASGEAADVTTGVARGDGCVPYNCIHPSR